MGSRYEGMVNSGYADGMAAHHDMMSFDAETGEPILIEVKATTGDADEAKYLSEGELQLLNYCAEHGVRYELHRPYHVNDPVRWGRRIYSA